MATAIRRPTAKERARARDRERAITVEQNARHYLLVARRPTAWVRLCTAFQDSENVPIPEAVYPVVGDCWRDRQDNPVHLFKTYRGRLYHFGLRRFVRDDIGGP